MNAFLSPPLFSVVIPVRNREQLVPQAIHSVINQTLQNFEIIVVDDGSDNHIKMHGSLNADPRIRILRQKSLGANAARNRGILEARGDFVAFLDVDDSFFPDKLETIAKNIGGKSVWFSHFAKVVRAENVYATRPLRSISSQETVSEYILRHGQFLQTSTLVVSRKAAKCIMFDENLNKFQDIDFAIRFAKSYKNPIFIEKELSLWSDVQDYDRISQKLYPETAIYVYDKLKDIVSNQELAAFAATMLGYEISKFKPFQASKFVIHGFTSRSIGLRTALRQMTRIWLSQKFYRTLVNSYLKLSNAI